MKKSKGLLIVVMMLTVPVFVSAQKKAKVASTKNERNIPMTADRWSVQPGKVEFTNHKGTSALKIQQNGGRAILKDLDFTNGIIEFDAEPLDAAHAPFVSIYFRHQNEQESEIFYLRVGREENHKRNDAVQYAPIIKAVNLWDMLPHYQAPAALNNTSWNHIKLVISEAQLRAYVNDMSRPCLEIPALEGNAKNGAIALEGHAAFANLVVKPGIVEDLPSSRGIDLTNHDAHYLRSWLVTQPQPLEDGSELSIHQLPNKNTVWDSLVTERNALVNLTRKYGVDDRRYVWLKTTIKSKADVVRKMQLGFSDEVWVFVNGRTVYVDKNLYPQGMHKTPNGRCSIDNASFSISLKAGENELLIGVANDFYGWGIIARLDQLDGIDLMR